MPALIVGCPTEVTHEDISIILSRFFWITYRHDMISISGTAFTGDSGWGCMIRSGQMLTATAMCAAIVGERTAFNHY